MAVTIPGVKTEIWKLDFIDVRVDRLIHVSGFDASEEPLRPVLPGSNEAQVLAANRGVVGPLMVEVGYGSGTVRVKFLRGVDLLETWDLDIKTGNQDQFMFEFTNRLLSECAQDEDAREQWADVNL